MGIKVIDKGYTWGVYIWQLPSGHLLHDGEGSFLSIQAYKDDFAAIKQLGEAAAHYGYPEGKAWWHPGGRQVTDSQYTEQLNRLVEGYIPSTDDLGAMYDAKQGEKENGDY